MTWGNRFRLLVGLVVVVAIVGAATLVLNQRESQVASTTASIKAISYSVGSDYAGTVVKQSVKQGDKVKQGDPLITIQSANLTADLANEKPKPTSTAYTVGSDGQLTLNATQPGIVSKVNASVGGFVSAGQPLARIDRTGTLYTLATFKLDPYDFSRIQKGARVDLALPNSQKVVGTVSVVRVQTVKGTADASVEIASHGLEIGSHNGLVQPGTPVTAVMHLREDGPFAGVKQTMHALLLQIGL
jgi:multidrug resistance efflux pump